MNILPITGDGLLILFFFSYIATMGFGILINIPHNALLGCGAVGSLGLDDIYFDFSRPFRNDAC